MIILSVVEHRNPCSVGLELFNRAIEHRNLGALTLRSAAI